MLRFGRLQPLHRPKLRFHEYKTVNLPTPPPSIDYTNGVCGVGMKKVFKNDTLGCCVISGMYHIVVIWSQGQTIATNQQIITDYSAIGGYVPGKPSTDQGCDEQTAFKYWMNKGYGTGGKLAGYLGVDATKKLNVMQSIDLFENLYLGIALPNGWVTPMPSKSGFTWDVVGAANPDQGHCIMAYGYNSKGILIDTWGMRGVMTWTALAKYAVPKSGGEAYTTVSQLMLNKAKAKSASGMAWTTLISDFKSLGGIAA